MEDVGSGAKEDGGEVGITDGALEGGATEERMEGLRELGVPVVKEEGIAVDG